VILVLFPETDFGSRASCKHIMMSLCVIPVGVKNHLLGGWEFRRIVPCLMRPARCLCKSTQGSKGPKDDVGVCNKTSDDLLKEL
jgi:hypothetical protein